MIMIVHPAIKVVVDRRFQVSTRVRARQKVYPLFAKDGVLNRREPLLGVAHGEHNLRVRVMVGEGRVAGAGR